MKIRAIMFLLLSSFLHHCSSAKEPTSGSPSNTNINQAGSVSQVNGGAGGTGEQGGRAGESLGEKGGMGGAVMNGGNNGAGAAVTPSAGAAGSIIGQAGAGSSMIQGGTSGTGGGAQAGTAGDGGQAGVGCCGQLSVSESCCAQQGVIYEATALCQRPASICYVKSNCSYNEAGIWLAHDLSGGGKDFFHDPDDQPFDMPSFQAQTGWYKIDPSDLPANLESWPLCSP